MVKLVIFDLWDTLVYLDHGWRTFNQLKPALSNLSREEWITDVKPLFLCKDQKTPEDLIGNIEEKFDVNLMGYADKVRYQLEEDIRDSKIYSDVIRTLKRLKNKGLKLAVASNQSSFFDEIYKKFNLGDYFDYEFFSFSMGCRKPDDEFYEKIIDLTNCSPQDMLFVGNHYDQDYVQPLRRGFGAIHLDRSGSLATRGSVFSLDKIL